ncbi:unnamed protein product, partial [Mesorhabditis spiculigera]
MEHLCDESTIYVIVLRVTAVLSIIINFGTAIVIYIASPPKMHTYRYHLLWYQFWSTSFELIIHLAEAHVFFPAHAFKLAGMAYTYFGIGIREIFMFGGVVVFGAVEATGQCIHYRHRKLLPVNHPLRAWWITIAILLPSIIYYLVSFLWSCAQIVCTTDVKSQTAVALLSRFPEYRCLSTLPDVFYCDALQPTPIFGIAPIFLICIIVVQLSVEGVSLAGFYLSHSFYLLDRATTMSEKTRRLQKQLIVNLGIQVAVPLCTLLIPWCVYAYIVTVRWLVDPKSAKSASWHRRRAHGHVIDWAFLTELRELQSKDRPLKSLVYPDLGVTRDQLFFYAQAIPFCVPYDWSQHM